MADSKSIILLQSFIKEKLGGDIRKLRDFDLCSLEEDKKYGSTNYTDAPIIKAILALAYGDIWPDLSYDKITRGAFECDKINKIENLFGINMNFQYFKGMQKFNPSPSQYQRAVKVTHMCGTIGNLWVLPRKESIAFCILDNGYRYYMDKFLNSIYAIFTQKKRVDKKLKSAIESNKKYFDKYMGEEGFKSFVSDMMLNDFVDYYGKPEETFMFVWSAMKDLDRNTYFKAVDQFCTFCEKFITKRGDKIIAKLEYVLKHPESAKEITQNNIKLSRYDLAYTIILQCLDSAMKDKNVGLSIMTSKPYFMAICHKMGLVPDGFSWNDFAIERIDLDESHPAIVYTFPKPLKEPEAIYGAIVINHSDRTVDYFTLEKSMRDGRWALGYNNPKERTLIGLYDIIPTKEKFYELIMGSVQLTFKVDVNAVLTMPEGYQKGETLPEDPDGCVNYYKGTSSYAAFIQAFPIPYTVAMSFGSPKEIIDGIHKSLSDNQALIEVKTGMTKRSYHYAYSIIKTLKDKAGVQYFLLLQIWYGHIVLNIKAFFDEAGITGTRDTTIWELMCREGIVSIEDKSNWSFDPYDKDFKHDYQMNLSEKEEYDKLFPEHPLSQCRQFANYVIEQSYLWKKK